ncbi:Sec14 cytosolic factor (Phosphatidylinositol/phosphatidyl-choline transfer protein) (PI/PC TP) (Sporulation-specific protein 20) [Durusdinium trenchii]|uniref:Sec14 cytosolic factor (Phosphatidylinositol/phosphatidyl-choline transfer protein) (PI/PC TP) (Sporulation-specific protein 20) n=1 Tax=Durusdinium trenchii TaxID=1381693 RepID=A0ABP0QK27_9DINO
MGRVKSYNTRKGFGFIMVPEFPRDVFVYNSHLIGRIGLLPGEPVLFDLVVEGGRPQARNVKVTGDATPVEQENSAENLATIKKVIAEQMPHLQPAPGGQSMRDYTLAMAAAAAEVPTTMPAGAQAAKSPEELLKEQIRKAQSDATSRQSPGMKPEVPIPRSDPGGNIPNGSKIKVVEFPAPDVNGCLGTVRGFDAASGRYSVEVQTHAGEMVPMSLREEYMEVQSREAQAPMTPAAPPPPLPGNSSQGLQKSAADALRRFGLGGFPPNQPNQGNANRGNWMGGQGGGGMMPNQGVPRIPHRASCSKPVAAGDAVPARFLPWDFETILFNLMRGQQDPRSAEVEALRGDAQEQGLEASDQDPFVEELLAYLRATGFDRPEALRRLLETQAYRDALDIEEKIHNATWAAKEEQMRRVLLYDYIGFDQHGRPVLLERVGAWRVDVVLRATEDLEEFKVLHAMANEILRQMKRPEGIQDPRGFILIIDLNGLSMAHLRPRLAFVFGEVSKIDEAHYPDTVAHIFVVNAPWIFRALFAMIQPFLNEDTLTKVHFSYEVPFEIVEHLGAEHLPQELRGSRAGVFPYDLAAPTSDHPVG